VKEKGSGRHPLFDNQPNGTFTNAVGSAMSSGVVGMRPDGEYVESLTHAPARFRA
jgi:hypothetical protein